MKPMNFPERLRQRRLRAIARTEGAIASLQREENETLLHRSSPERSAQLHHIRGKIGRHRAAIEATLPKVGQSMRDTRTKKDRTATAKFRRAG